MNKHIRRSKFTKFLACYLAMMILLQITAPMQAYALTEGPSQPEFNSFTPIGTSDMVDLASGDFNYNIPIMDVGGYPINLAYNSGVTMDQEASWVGLGWNLNVGQINRNVRGLPDDFKGDVVSTENNMKTNVTVGVNPYINMQLIGLFDDPNMGLSVGAGLDVQHNNYVGFKATPSFGASFKFSSMVSVGMQLSSSVEDGVSVSPSVSLSAQRQAGGDADKAFSGTISPSINYNSRQGLQAFNISAGIGYINGEDSKHHGANSSSVMGGTASYSFVNNTFTPVKRLAFKNNNVRFSFSGGGDVWGVHGEITIAGYGSVQKLVDKKQLQYAYGYENTDLANEFSLLDFNREKEQGVVSKQTMVLPVTNYTYDLYTIQGQGTGGMFRPFRGQMGYVYDSKVIDQSSSDSFSFELEVGAGGHVGANFRNSISNSYTGNWETASVMPFLKERTQGNKPDYEKVYHKSIGETRTDERKGSLYLPSLNDPSPITLKLDQNKNAVNVFRSKYQPANSNESLLVDGIGFSSSSIKRENRELRNTMIQKVTKREAKQFSLPFINYNGTSVIDPSSPTTQVPLVPEHHTAGYIVTDESGNRHIYGETVYNKEKKEVSFNIGKPSGSNLDLNSGQAKYAQQDNSSSNSKGRDNYFNSIKTPAYAHTYLLTSILSSDYEDISKDGPTDDDLGSYTKFIYKNQGDYKWRVPYGKMNGAVSSNVASYNEGLKTDNLDQKGSYLYGVKENKYLTRIETKTHVAFIDLERRADGVGVSGENGGGAAPGIIDTGNQMFRIKTIRLYSKPDVRRATLLGVNAKPIKTAHFEYDYSLCQKIDNNFNIGNGQKGKLTLKKVYFTYGGSNMGKFAPYRFDYKGPVANADYNPDYNVKAYDIWGNYKAFIANSAGIDSQYTTPQEFPYVDQKNKDQQNLYAAAWTLHSIELPSGGKIKVAYEADDYKYVQDKKAMQMFKVDGMTSTPSNYNPNSHTENSKLYDSNAKKYVVLKIDQEASGSLPTEIAKKYTEGLDNKPVYFNFLVNMTSDSYDYVSGYFEMDGNAIVSLDKKFLFVPMKLIDMEGRNTDNGNASPIAVAGWFFGRQNLNGFVYGGSMTDPGASVATNVVDIGKSIVNNIGELVNIFKGANAVLKGKSCAKYFKPAKSWIRLNEPTGTKLGGGSRVKEVMLFDEWDKMLDLPSNTPAADLARYAKQYGQKYEYDFADGTSTGVATYEPNASKENPLIVPFYHRKERLTEQTYQEKPFGESFFPAPTVTYSRVKVSNISGSASTSTSGSVVTEHFTSYDFPTRTDFTNLDKSKEFNSNEGEAIGNMLKGLLSMKINTQVDLTMTQGFVVETNDMNGKLKKQEVFNNNGAVISSVEYKYSTQEAVGTTVVKDERILENKLPVIREDGTIAKAEIATHYDVVNDLRESFSHVNSNGVAANVDFIPLVFIPIVIGWASAERSEHKQILRTAVTTKVIHKSGILKEKIASDLGSVVSTKNLAWDAKTGQVLLTETINEFDDKYYSFNYPAYWHYKEMGLASENADIQGKFDPTPDTEGAFKMLGLSGTTEISKYLKPGDELSMFQSNRRVWVSGYGSNNSVSLITANGNPVTSLTATPSDPVSGLHYNTSFRVIRSAYRNNQMASMGSITLMRNPITTTESNPTGYKSNINSSFTASTKIINASAVEYSDSWEAQCENGLRLSTNGTVNKYLYNIKGDWRPVKSYAYLTGRTANDNGGVRNAGYFSTFTPFYKIQSLKWIIDRNNWTYASEVTKYNPFGVEVENKDALSRYSSAQYGYKYKLPVAVASNAEYREMGFDGFEDYDSKNWTTPSTLRPHFGFNEYIQKISENVGAFISDKKAHTGTKSLLVTNNKSIKLTRTVNSCE